MNGADRLCAAIRARAASNHPALVAFLTAGYPQRADFGASLRAIATQADVIEIGVPFTDPMADGVTIQRATHAALQAGVTLPWILEQLHQQRLQTPLVLMSYLNPLLAFGLDELAAAAARAGVAGFIVPDLPFEECAPLRTSLQQHGIALVQMVTPVTPRERLHRLCEASSGFVYAVTMTGTTGRSVAVPDEVLRYLDEVRAAAHLPVCAGFGIRERSQVERLRGHVAGVIVGSALVEVLENGGDPANFLASLR